jgi:hypothetical protein
MLTTVFITAAAYCVALHAVRRVRAYVPPGKARAALDATLRALGGGGGGPAEPF